MIVATTRGALMRGTTTQNALGDDVDDNAIPFKVYTDWVEQRRNLAFNPLFRTTVAPWSPRGAATLTLVSQAARATTPGAGGQEGIMWTSGQASQPGAPYSFAVDITAPLGARMLLRLSNNVNAVGETAFVGTGSPQRVGVGVTAATANLTLIACTAISGGAQALAFDFDNVAHEMLPASGLAFDGDTSPGGELERTRWLGTPNASASVLETRSIVADCSDFPISIVEKSRREFDQASNTWRSVRYLSGRVSARIPVKAGDRIRDNHDGKLYIVEEVESMARGLSGRSSVTLTMKRAA